MNGEGAPLEPLEERAAEKGSEDDAYWRAAALRAGAGGGKGGGDADSEPLLPAGSAPSLGAMERLAARASALSAGGAVRRLAVEADGSTAVSAPQPPPLPWSSPSVTGLQEDQ